MRPFLLTSISGGGIVLISYVGFVRSFLYGLPLPSWVESLRYTLFVVAWITLIVGCLELL